MRATALSTRAAFLPPASSSKVPHPGDEVAAVAERAANDDTTAIEPVAPEPERHLRRFDRRPQLAKRA